MTERRMHAGELLAKLEKRFAAPEWAFMREVPDRTGGARTRADAMALNCWRSRGLELHGIEVKVTRGDWRRELKNPAKSDPIQRYCDRWWIVAPSADVVPLEEVPETWGLMLIKGRRGLVAVKQAPALDPVPLDRAFVAALGRAMHGNIERAMERAMEQLASDDDYLRGVEDGKAQAGSEGAAAIRQLGILRASVAEFTKKSGLEISLYNGRDVGEAVKKLLGTAHATDRLRRAHREMVASIGKIGIQLEVLEDLERTPQQESSE